MKALETSRKATMQSNRERLIKMAARISSMLGPVKPPPQTVTVKGLAPPPSPTATGGVPSAAPVKTQGFRTTSPAVEMAGIPKVPTTPAMPTTPSTAATPAMPKVAAAKWRELVRSGQASDAVKQGLHSMGLLGTPEAIAREARGINRGTRLLSRRHGIKHEKWREEPSIFLPSFAGHAATGLYPVKETLPSRFTGLGDRLHDAEDRLYALRSRRVGEALKRGATDAEIDAETRAFTDNFRKRNSPYMESLRAGKLIDERVRAGKIKNEPRHGPTYMERVVSVAPTNRERPEISALTRRHEVDETLLGGVLSAGKRPVFSSHVSPEVIAREAGHANFLFPSVTTPKAAPRAGEMFSLSWENANFHPADYRSKEITAINNVKQGAPANGKLVSPKSTSGVGAPDNYDPLLTSSKAVRSDYRKFYGDYYGMSKKKRVKFDEAAAAQFGYLPYGKTPPATSQYQR